MANFVITSSPNSVLVEIDGKKSAFGSSELHPYTPDGSGDTLFLYDTKGIFKAIGLKTLNMPQLSRDRIPIVLGVDSINVDGVTSFADADTLLLALQGVFFLGNGQPNGLTTYRANNYTDLITNIATSPEEGQTAYVINSQGTEWLPGKFGGTWYGSGLYYYDGTEWDGDKENIARQLQINIDDIEAIENVNANQDTSIGINALSISTNASNIAANTLAIASAAAASPVFEYLVSDYLLEDSTTIVNIAIILRNVGAVAVIVNTVALDKIEGEDSLILYPDESFTIVKRAINDYRII